MDNSAVFQLMLDKAIGTEPSGFAGFDRIKNVQDQLQEMLGSTRCVTTEGFNHFCGVINEGIWFIKPEYFDFTMEQLWLAFVMKEKYQKVWDGEDWIKEKQNG